MHFARCSVSSCLFLALRLESELCIRAHFVLIRDAASLMLLAVHSHDELYLLIPNAAQQQLP